MKEKKEIFDSLSLRPKTHTYILIKNMLGASKTISDAFIGSVHESVPINKDYSSEVQGLPGRMCGWLKRRGPSGPTIYCEKHIIENYLLLYDSAFDFETEDLAWSDSRLKVSERGISSKRSYLFQDKVEDIQEGTGLTENKPEINTTIS